MEPICPARFASSSSLCMIKSTTTTALGAKTSTNLHNLGNYIRRSSLRATAKRSRLVQYESQIFLLPFPLLAKDYDLYFEGNTAQRGTIIQAKAKCSAVLK